jgi:hypothetical protein
MKTTAMGDVITAASAAPIGRIIKIAWHTCEGIWGWWGLRRCIAFLSEGAVENVNRFE